MIKLLLKLDSLLFGDLGASGFYPLPSWLRWYFDRLTKLRRIQVYSRLVKGVPFWRNAPPELACAESVTRILNILFGFPIITGTYTLLRHLERNKMQWLEIQKPVNGCVVLAATSTGYPNTIGHVATYDNGRLWSNSSHTGLWGSHHTMQAFVYYYETQRGMRVRYFIPKQQ